MRHKLVWPGGIMLLSVLILYLINFIASTTYIGVTVYKDSQDAYFISGVSLQGWGHRNGLKRDDRIIEVNDMAPESHNGLRIYHKLEKIKQLKINRDGSIVEYKIEPGIYSNNVLYHLAVPFILLFISIILSFFLYRKNNKAAHMLILFLLCMSIAYVSAGASARGDIISRFINILTFLACPILLIHFIRVYFKKYHVKLVPAGINVAAKAILAINLILEGILLLGFISFSTIRSLNLLSFLVLSALLFFILTNAYIQLSKTRLHSSIKILFYSTLGALAPFVFLYLLPYLMFGVEIFPPALLGLPILLMPAAFIYLLFTSRFFDIEFMLNRLRLNLILSIFPSAVMMVLLELLHNEWSAVLKIQLFIIFYILVNVTLNVDEHLRGKFKQTIFRKNKDFNEQLFLFMEKVKNEYNRKGVYSQLIKEIENVLGINQVDVIEVMQESSEAKFYKGLIMTNSLDIGDVYEDKDQLYILVYEKKDSMTWVRSSNKEDFTKLNRDEKNWIKTLISIISLVIDNFAKADHLLQDLEDKQQSPLFSKLMISIDEKQRAVLAKDLHDGLLQEQLFLKRKLQSMSGYLAELPKPVQETIKDVDDGLLEISNLLRETCNELMPSHLKEVGLVRSMDNLMRRFAELTNINAYLDILHLNQPLSYEYQLGIYRIFQELLNNARKHSKAEQLFLTAYSDREAIYIHYEDNGIGILPEKLKEEGHKILFSIRERVRSLGGELTIESVEGSGLNVFIKIGIAKEAKNRSDSVTDSRRPPGSWGRDKINA